MYLKDYKADSLGFIQGKRPLTFRKAEQAALNTACEKDWKGNAPHRHREQQAETTRTDCQEAQ